MKLSKILNGLNIAVDNDCEISGITNDSREIKENFLFIAVKGLIADGHNYLDQAKKNGACAAIVETINPDININQIKVSDIRSALALIAANYYNNPTKDFNLIGITGTNGKTTVSFMLESIYKAAGKKTGLIGTVRYSIGNINFKVTHTTPESLQLQQYFSDMKKEKVDFAIIEASSHAIDLRRIDNSEFNQVLFTNLTQDHFDYHENFENYFKAKSRLFEINPNAKKIINIDDEYGLRLAENLGFKNVLTYGISKEADYMAFDIDYLDDHALFKVKHKDEVYQFRIMQLGLFNIYNALAAIVSALENNINPNIIQEGFDSLINVVGRFELIRIPSSFKVIVDYAHTPDGLKNLLLAAKDVADGKVITVFGCGGERDKGKRPKMGAIAKELSDIVIATSDNPRSEDPERIIEEIIDGNEGFNVEADRYAAINTALKSAKNNDIVVIAGKGHETTQEINGKHIHFSDKEVVEEIWSKMHGVNQ